MRTLTADIAGKPRYQDPASTQTLREGLAEYYAIHPEFVGEGEFLGQSRQTVVDHDMCHVVFGIGTSSKEELLIETITLFGCDVPVKKMPELATPAFFKSLWTTFGPWRLIKRFTLTVPMMLRTLWMTLRMKKRWPHFDYAAMMDRQLDDVRREYGIRVIRAY